MCASRDGTARVVPIPEPTKGTPVAILAELEAEAETVRAELVEMDMLTSQTEAAVVRLLSSVLTANTTPIGAPTDSEIMGVE